MLFAALALVLSAAQAAPWPRAGARREEATRAAA